MMEPAEHGLPVCPPPLAFSGDFMNHPETPSTDPIRKCRWVMVQDQLQPCPYRDNTMARMPLRLPLGDVSGDETDQMLRDGYRRSGNYVYRTQCPQCTECHPTRVDVHALPLTKSMKRVLKRGDSDLTCQVGQPLADDQRTRLFNRHRVARELGNPLDEVDVDSYRSFLVDSCFDTREISLFHTGKLIAVSIFDVGTTSISAVYTHFDPDYGRYSLGTYAVLKQIQWAKQHGRRHVYLGMYVAENRHLNYKARYTPQQRLVAGRWSDFPRDEPGVSNDRLDQV